MHLFYIKRSVSGLARHAWRAQGSPLACLRTPPTRRALPRVGRRPASQSSSKKGTYDARSVREDAELGDDGSARFHTEDMINESPDLFAVAVAQRHDRRRTRFRLAVPEPDHVLTHVTEAVSNRTSGPCDSSMCEMVTDTPPWTPGFITYRHSFVKGNRTTAGFLTTTPSPVAAAAPTHSTLVESSAACFDSLQERGAVYAPSASTETLCVAVHLPQLRAQFTCM